jgi:FkbM family methyltransferase
VNLRQFIKYVLWKDTTHCGEFQTLWKLLPPDAPKVVVDVGAYDGFYGSNSFPFVARGWAAILIEPHPVAFAQLQKRFARAKNVTCLNMACAERAGERPLYIGTDGESPTTSTLCDNPAVISRQTLGNKPIMVPVDTLANILNARQVPRDFGVLTVDTEAMDYEVLVGLDCSVWRPRVIITEDYAPKEAAKAQYLKSHGYQLRAGVASNTVWSMRV